MTINVEELKKQGLTNLAELLESKVDETTADDTQVEEESTDTQVEEESTIEQTSENVDSICTDSFDKLFEGVEGLPENFADKLKVTFVANVNERVEEIVNEKLKTIEEKVAEALAEQEVEQEQSINTYLTYVAEQWLEENKQAIESAAQVKLTQSFMIGLRELFESHNIEIPEGKTDIVEELETELAESKGVIEALTAQLNSIKEDMDSKEKNNIVESACAGLTETESEKFRKLAEEFVNEDVESFTRKVDAIKEYFKADTSIEPKKVDESTAEVIDVPEDKSLDESSEAPKTKVVSPRMQSYLAALRKGNRA